MGRVFLLSNRRKDDSFSHRNELDIWLNRLSHFSQFGLFALTVGALYFTVIPLYKTAVLEEAIAKREVELHDAEFRLAKAEKTLAEVAEKTYVRDRNEVMRSFIMRASAECSGLLKRSRELYKRGEPKRKWPILDIDVAKCLSDELNTVKPADTLRPADYQYLVERIRALGQGLELRREETMKKIAEVPEQAAQGTISLEPKGEQVAALDEFLIRSKQVFPESPDWKRIQLEGAIERTQYAMERKFNSEVMQEVDALRTTMLWPKAEPERAEK